MKHLLFLLPVAALAVTGCGALDSLIFHPIHVVHEEHVNQEQEERAYRGQTFTNAVVNPP